MGAKKHSFELLGRGLYSPAEVGRLVGISAPRVRRWVQGYRYIAATDGGRHARSLKPVIDSDLPVIQNLRAVSFLELVEILVVSSLLERGVSMRVIRRARKRASEIFRNNHPFAYQKFKTDGKGVFTDLIEESEAYKGLLELSRGQYSFPEILEQYLEQIDFDLDTLLALRWWPLGKDKPVVLDPRVAFGTPIISGTRIPVRTILHSLRAGETQKSVCDWFGLQPRDVRAALRFGEVKGAA